MIISFFLIVDFRNASLDIESRIYDIALYDAPVPLSFGVSVSRLKPLIPFIPRSPPSLPNTTQSMSPRLVHLIHQLTACNLAC